jgi:hypothetical protein
LNPSQNQRFDAHLGPRLDSSADFLSTRREFRDEYPSEQADQDAEAFLRRVP